MMPPATMEPLMQFLRITACLSMTLVLASCGGAKVPDQQRAEMEAVERMLDAAKGAHPNGKVVLVLPAAVEYQGTASEGLASVFKKSWKAAPLVEHRLARSSDSGIKENPAEFRRFAASVGTLSAEEAATLKSAHPDARLFVSFCGLPQTWKHEADGPKWVAFCPNGAKGGAELAAAGALIAVVQPRTTAPTPDLDDFDTFYTFDTPATLTSTAPAP